MKVNVILCAVLASLSLGNSAVAAERGYYFGGGVGSASIDDGGMNDYRSTPTTMKADDNSFHFMGGYKFNRVASLELQYTNYGDVKTKRAGKNVMTWSPTAISLSGNIGYTFNNGFRPYGIIGLSYIDLDMKLHPELHQMMVQKNAKVNDSGDALRIGLGIEYTPKVAEGVSFRAGYESDIFDFKHFDTQTYSVTLGSFFVAGTYHF
jgi:opacity protein-like surface antigen